MRKKHFPKNRLLVCLLSGLLFSVCLAGDLEQDKTGIIALIKSGQMESAAESVDKLLVDYSQSPDLPEALYWIARHFGWSNNYEEEKNVYQKLIQNWPDNYYSNKARLGCRRTEVLSLIVSQDYGQAGTALDKLITDFNEHPDLPDTLYWVAQRYGYAKKYEEEKSLYQQIIEEYPDSSVASRAKLGYPSAQVRSFIVSQNYDKAKEALNKLVADFNSQPDLPDMLYRLARGYEWQDRYKEANDIYQQIMTNYPDSSIAGKAKLDIQRAQIRSLIVLEDCNEVNVSLDKLIADFNGNPDLPEALYWIAQRYGYSGRFEEEKDLYQYIVTNYPDSSYADKAAVQLSLVLLRLGGTYYTQGLSKKQDGLDIEAVQCFKKALCVYEGIIQQFPSSAAVTQAKYFCGDCYILLGQSEKALPYFNDVLSKNSDGSYAEAIRLRKERCKSKNILGE